MSLGKPSTRGNTTNTTCIRAVWLCEKRIMQITKRTQFVLAVMLSVERLAAQSSEIVLHLFAPLANGGSPSSGVIRDSAGNLFGTTSAGGTGDTPKHFIKSLRMLKSATLLAETTFSMKEVMGRVGLADKSHFTRDFAEFHGILPSRYRQQHHGRCAQ